MNTKTSALEPPTTKAVGPDPVITRVRLHDGATTELRALAAVDEEAFAVLIAPAMGVSAHHYDGLVAALRARGLHAGVADLRGVGSSSIRASRSIDFGYGVLADDLGPTSEALRAACPRTRGVVVLGHSLGGQVAVLALALGAVDLAGVALVASGTPYANAFRGSAALAVRFLAAVTPPVAALVGYHPGPRFGFGGREARTLMREWSALARHGTFALRAWSGPRDPEASLRDVETPLLAITIDGDTFAPSASMDELLAKVPRCEVVRAYEGGGAAPSRIHHFSWVRRPDAVAARVARWIADGQLTRNRGT
jgi:predicted alpha/beta hydrolase